MRKIVLALAVLATGSVAHAQSLFSGPSFFNVVDTTMGPSINTLTLTDTADGFTVTGVFNVLVPGAQAGTVLYYEVLRPLNPLYGTNTNLNVITELDGFSQSSGALNSTGEVFSEFDNYPSSRSTIPINLVAGNETWNNLSSTTSFSYTSIAGNYYLRQIFNLPGETTNPGLWTVDVPVTTRVIPEPAAIALVGIGFAFVVTRRKPKRQLR
jgi:hypothetical protein